MTNPNDDRQPAVAGEQRGTVAPSPAEQRDPGAHDRGGWLTLDEASRRFGVEPHRLRRALSAGRITGRRVAGEGLAPPQASPDAMVPPGAPSHPAAPADDWLVQPEQVQRLVTAEAEEEGAAGGLRA